MSDWCTIESDPGVFTSLIESFGVTGAELDELWSLDDASLHQLGTVYGLIFLFKWSAQDMDDRPSLSEEQIPEDLFFAKQTVTNACATQAILSVLLNAPSDEDTTALKLGPILSTFKSFTLSFPPDLKGEAIGSSEDIRISHNSFSRNDPFLSEEKKQASGEDDNVFHFIAYIPHQGKVFELDGLKPGPIVVGSYDGSDAEGGDLAWLSSARMAIQERIERYSASEIKFNLMAVVRDRRMHIQESLKLLMEAGMAEDEEDVLKLRAQIAAEEEKREGWKRENERRRHNYLPFCVELLKALARSGKLPQLTREAGERVAAKKRKMNNNKSVSE